MNDPHAAPLLLLFILSIAPIAHSNQRFVLQCIRYRLLGKGNSSVTRTGKELSSSPGSGSSYAVRPPRGAAYLVSHRTQERMGGGGIAVPMQLLFLILLLWNTKKSHNIFSVGLLDVFNRRCWRHLRSTTPRRSCCTTPGVMRSSLQAARPSVATFYAPPPPPPRPPAFEF